VSFKPEDNSVHQQQCDARSVVSGVSTSKYSDKQLFARLGDRFVCIDSEAPMSNTAGQRTLPSHGYFVDEDNEDHDENDENEQERASYSTTNNSNRHDGTAAAPLNSINTNYFLFQPTSNKGFPAPALSTVSSTGKAAGKINNNNNTIHADERFCDSGLAVDDCSSTVATTPPSSRSMKTSFVNDSYAQMLAPLRQVFPGKPTHVGTVDMVAPNSRPKFANPDLNYANSITVVKQQIARAKANFFATPLSR